MTARRPQAVPARSCRRELAECFLMVALWLATVAGMEYGLIVLAQMAQGGR